jgi:hypothetical protein
MFKMIGIYQNKNDRYRKGGFTMENAEILEKINNVKTKESTHEIFFKVRPPEEFGDAVKLLLNNDGNTFKAVVFDPDTLTEFYEKTLTDQKSAYSFISQTLEGKKNEGEKEHLSGQIEYINLY